MLETGENIVKPHQSGALDQVLKKKIDSIPDKMAFKIGEVAQLLEVKSYVLRYWETEFDFLKPKKSKHNQRVYSRKDIENLYIIQKLLYKDRFSIEGARGVFKSIKKQLKAKHEEVKFTEQKVSFRSQLESLIQSITELKSEYR